MIAVQALALVRQSIRRGRRAFALSVFGIVVGISSLTFFLALSAGVRHRVLARVFPAGRLSVVPAKSSLDSAGALSSLVGGLAGLGGPRALDEAAVSALRARPEVKAVYPRMKIAFPTRGWGGERFLGRPVYTELIVDGIDPSSVSEEQGQFGPERFEDLQKPGKFCTEDANCQAPTFCAWDIHQCQLPIPVIISPLLIEIYNGSIAKAHNLPRISGFLLSQFRGLTFTAELGKSFLSQRAFGTPRQRRMMLVGVSDRAIPLGLTVPLPYVQRWNAEYAGERAEKEYSSLSVEVRPGASITAVVDAVRKLGFAIEDNGAEQAGLAVTLLTALFLLVSLSIMLVAAVNIAHTFYRTVSERRRELGVMRAVGASAADIQVLLLSEAAAVGLCGGGLGLLLSYLLSVGIDLFSRRMLPDFPFKPETYFSFSPGLCVLAMSFSVAACVIGAYLPAKAAARLSPAAALTAI